MEQGDHPIGVLRAQLHQPPPSRHAVTRPALLRRLDLALERRLTLVSAPAGYGKTTLVSQWLSTIALPAAWLSLDERDDSLRMFPSCFVAAVHTLFPNACEWTERLLQAPLLAPLDYLTVSLINELAHITQPFVLVIDDYHLIHDADVHRVLDEVLRQTLPSLHLVVATRSDPPLALHRLAAQGHVVSLRAADLRFRQDEAASALEQWLGRRLSDESVKMLLDQTEGWVAGLWLTNLWLQEATDVDLALTKISASTSRSVIAYLDGEVFQRLPTDVQDFILRTSILDSFSADLCDAILENVSQPSDAKPNARDMLMRLENANLFIAALDHTHDWFRYHHLFRDWLRRRLRHVANTDDIAALHRRAAIWWDRYGDVDQAIGHALAAGEEDLAADIVERNRRRVLNSDQWQDLKRWLSLLPAALVQRRPALLIAQAWGFHFALNFGAIQPILADAAALLESQTPSSADAGGKILRAEIATLRAEMLYFAGQADAARALFQFALADLPADDGFARGVAWLARLSLNPATPFLRP